MRTLRIAAALLGGCLLPVSALADVYKYVAPNGSVYYTDEPPNSKYKLILRRPSRSGSGGLKSSASLEKKRIQFAPLIKSVADKHRLDPRLLHAVIRAESAYNPRAVSKKGAVGLMQLMPDTAKRYGVTDRHDPDQNVDGGARYLKDLLRLFNSDLRLAVAAYNAGEGAVMKYNNRIPPYPETQHYVKRVLDLYRGSSKL